MKKIFFLFLLMIPFSLPALSAGENPLPTTDEVISAFRAAEAKLDSYSYTAHRLDIADQYVKNRHEEGLKSYEAILNMLKRFDKKEEAKPENFGYMTTHSHLQFVKPLTLEISLDVNDYIPGYLQGARVAYDPDINPGELFLKEPNVGLMLRNSAQDDSAITIVVNWTYDLIELDCALKNGGTTTMIGEQEFEGKDVYVVQVGLSEGETPWKMGCGGNTYGVPEEAFPQLNRELEMVRYRIEQKGDAPAIIEYSFDKGSGLLISKTFKYGDITIMNYWIEDIVLNKVDKKKILKPKKPKKKLF